MKKVGRKAASILLTLCMLLTMLPVSALAVDEGTVVDTAPAETNLAEPANNGNSSSDDSLPVSTLGTDPEGDADVSVEYVDENKVARTCTDYTVVTSSDTVWSADWYVVTDTVDLTGRVQVSGNVHLILTDDAALNAEKGGIGVTAGNSLTIYGQRAGTGTLTARAYQVRSAAAIGGNDDSGAHGDITINGGVINATGASDAAGIGGGRSATGRSGTITINGGTVKATSGGNGAGIGGGYANGADGGDITITGGDVTAVGGIWAAGIGTGFSGAGMKITITGGKVTATGGSNDTYGGAGIGANYGGSTNPVSITITGSADVTATGGLGAAGIGGGSGNAEAAVDTIVIDGSAKVHATGGNSDTYGGAGIGAGGSGACGSITISGGAKVTATGGAGSSYGGAGIGAGGKGPCDSITISGSADVTAVGGAGDTRGGAGIGAGGGINIDGSYRPIPSCNRIEITGGTVDATGGEDSGSSKGADGIGGNSSTSSTVGSVSISGGAFTANTFDKGIPDGYLAEGFTLVENEDGTWGVTKDDTTTDTGVAQIGNQTYATLEQAFGAVGSEAVTIKLLADTQISNAIEVAAGETIVLDLNGCAVTVPEAGSDGRSLYALNNYGTLTIKDISGSGEGSITARGMQNLGSGVLTIESGTFVSCDANGGAAVWNEATAYINGGTFKTMHVGSASDNYGPGCLNNSGTAVITAGTFESVNKRTYAVISTGTITITPAEGKEVIVSGAHGGLGVDSGDAVVNGGSFSSTEYYGLYVSNDGMGADPMKAAVTVNGGTFTGAKYSVWIGSDYNNPVNSTIAIYNGTFTKPLNAQENTREGAVKVYGGTFYQEVPQEYCADGFVPKQNNDGTWGVVTETTYVAQIGETNKYATLSEALNAVKDGETIKVLAPATVDMAETYEITGKAITLYLNGQTVTWNTSAKEAITVKDGGNLTIQDTSANEAGELAFTSTYTDSGDSTGIYVNPDGTFALQSGTISYTAAKAGRAIYVGGTGTFAMSGGIVKIAGSAKYGVYLSSNNSTNITGGEIILSDTLTGTTLYGLYVYMPADAQGLAIENLTVDASAVPAAQCAYCITGGWNSANNAPVTISGGTYTTNENTLSKAIYYSTVKNLTISGGTFNGVVYSATTITDGTFQKAVEVTDTITGGTFEGKVTAPRGKISGGKFKVVNPPHDWNLADGKSFEQKDGYYCVVDDTNTKVAEVDGVQYATLEEAIKKAQSGQTVELLANATVLERIAIADKNITIDTNGYSVIYSGDADHKSAIIDLEGKAQVVVTGNGTFTFNDAYLDYNGFGYIFRLYDNSVLTIENGTYYAGLTCVQVGDSSAAYIKDGHFSASTDWKDTWWVLNRIDNNNSKFYVSGGTFVNYDPTNSDTESPADNFCTPEYAATPTKDESGNTIYTVVEAEARIGETGYVTLADAIAAAGDNDTITLLADVTEDVVVPAGKNITLDLYGHKITNDSDHTIVNNGTLTITDSSEAKTGTVDNVTHGKGALVNNGTVKLSGGTFERSLEAGTLAGANGNSWYTIVNDGTMIIENGVTVKNKGGFSSMICNSKSGVMGNLTIDGGTFDGGINTVKNDVNSTLTINGGTFTNSAQYVIMNWNKATINDGTFATKDTAYAVLFTSSWQNASTSVGELVITGGTFTTATEEQKLIVDRYDADNIGTASISGGTFSEEPDDTYLVDGYAPEQNEDGNWVVVEEAFVAEIVGGEKYESLIEAVDVAKVSSGTVKLLADVELQPVEGKDYALLIDNGQSMTLDLNGHKITATLNNTAEFNLIKNYGELTITDTSEGKGGSIEVTENGSAEKSRTSVIYNGYSSGEFTLEAGTLKLTGGEGSKKPLYGVYSSGTTVVMNGGAIEVRRLNSYYEYSESWDVYGIYNSSGCQTTVNGGTITVENQGMYNSAYGIFNAGGTVSIHGTPETPYIAANAFNTGIYFEHTLYGNITLYGGKYNMQTDTATGWIEGENNITIAEGYEKKFNGNRTVSIVKSPVAQIGSTKYDTLEEALKEAKSGDTIKLLQNVALTDRVIISKNITLNLNDKTISSTADYAFIVNTGSSFTLENGTLSASKNGVFGLTSSTVTLASDATINAGAAGITATNNLLEQGNATINVYGTIDSEDVAVWGQGPNNTINVDGATITSKYFGVYQNGSFGGTTITIKNSTITDESENGTGIYVSNNGTNAANPDQGFQNLIIENSTITGNTAVEVKFTNVTISGDDTCLTATGTPVDSGMNNNGSVTTGYALAVTHNGTESSKDAAEGTVTISGGKFTGAVGIQEPSEGETTSATIAISGGSFSEEPNKDYLAPYYEATQNTTGDNYWTVDVAEEYEATWTNGETLEAGTLNAMLIKANEAKAGTVALLQNVTASGIHVSAGVTLDLAGHELDATGSDFTAYGKVVDSTEGGGLLKLPAEYYTIEKDNPSLPIYDRTAGGYRLYTYQLTTLQTYEPGTANTVQFWFKLTFTNEDAWELLKTGNENHGITVKSKYQFSGQTASESWLSFNSEFIHWIADQVVSSQHTQDQLGFYLNVTNTNLLGERTMTVTPAVDSVPSVGTESQQMTYSLNLEE